MGGNWTWGVGGNRMPFRHDVADNAGVPIMVDGPHGTWGWSWGPEPYAWKRYAREPLWLQILGQGTGEEPDESTSDHWVGRGPELVDRLDRHQFLTGQNGPCSLTPSW